jgi:hypothetical protein
MQVEMNAGGLKFTEERHQVLEAPAKSIDRPCADEVDLSASDCFAKLIEARSAISTLGTTDPSVSKLNNHIPAMTLRGLD